MKLGIAAKLGLLLALVSMLAAGLTGLYAYQASRALLLRSAKSELLTSTAVLARRISLSREEVSRNLLILAGHPAVIGALQKPDAAMEDQVTTLFEQMLLANPAYFQIRLIEAGNNGQERVRMDRDDDSLLRVSGDELQEKGHFPYVSGALRLAPGTAYLSRIVINHERGSHAGLDQPSVILSMPVVSGAGSTLGVVVVNVDLNATFKALAADLPDWYQLYLANGAGDFLIHPDRSKTFGFDRGQRVLLQNEFPEAADLVNGSKTNVMVDSAEGIDSAQPIVAAFLGRGITVSSTEERMILGLAVPRARILAQADELGQVVLQLVLGLCVAGILIAALVARVVTRPINSISAAVQRFATDHQVEKLPTERQDEIGVLAQSFARMQDQITAQMRALEAGRHELELLARHDPMTGLSNRRHFQEKLEGALARAQRSKSRFAILFIDVDEFKRINDRYGHEAGDEVLKTIASRLQSNTRKVDAVARMGGDEFVVLLDGTDTREDIAAIAEKLLEQVGQPILCGGDEVHVGLSVGVSQYPENGTSASGLLSSADHAMYKSKNSGHSGYRFSDSNLGESDRS